jgi:hypothetical protein
MTSTITAATLKVTITEELVLNGVDQGGTNELSCPLINEIFKRIITVPSSAEVNIYATTDTVAGGSQFKSARVQYVRLTNKDDTNFIRVVVKNEGNDEYCIKLSPGESWLSYDQNDAMDAIAAGAVAVTSGHQDIILVSARADTASCDLEVFIAQT